MDTSIFGCINLNEPTLDLELSLVNTLELQNVYQEFICGSWLTLALWNGTGRSHDLIIKTYSGAAKPTTHVKNLPTLVSILKRHFNFKLIKYVRLALLGPGSVILPHIDYLETKQEFLRFHIPLITDELCLYAEEKNIYNLNKGEIYFINARKAHSVACFSNCARLHLILDIPHSECLDTFINKDVLFEKPQKLKSIEKKSLSPEQYQSILALSELITINNFMDVASILTKLIYQVESPVTAVFFWLKEIAQKNGNQQLITKINQLQQHCIHTRQIPKKLMEVQ